METDEDEEWMDEWVDVVLVVTKCLAPHINTNNAADAIHGHNRQLPAGTCHNANGLNSRQNGSANVEGPTRQSDFVVLNAPFVSKTAAVHIQ